MAKAGVIGLTIAMANEGEPVGIAANVVAPYAKTRPGTGFGPIPWSEGLAEWLHPRRVAPVVTWLAHDSCEANGECYAVGGGHVARVAFAVNDGFTDREMTPESVAANAALLAAPADRPGRRARLTADAQHDGRLHRLIRRSVDGSPSGGLPPTGRERSGGGEDVDDEHQGVGAADAGRRVAVGAVALVGRDHEQHPGADGLADEALVPAGDELAGADDEVGRLRRAPTSCRTPCRCPRSRPM